MNIPSWAVVKTNYGLAQLLSTEKQPFPNPFRQVETDSCPLFYLWYIFTSFMPHAPAKIILES